MKIGVYIRNYSSEKKYKYICSCGNKFYANRDYNVSCEECDNTYFVSVYRSTSISECSFETTDTNNKIHSVRTIYNFKYNDEDETLLLASKTGRYEFIMDFKNWEFYFLDGKGNRKEFYEGSFRYFLKRNCNYNDFIESCTLKNNRDLLSVIRKFDGYHYSPAKAITKFVSGNYSCIQTLIYAGYNKNFIGTCIYSGGSYFNSNAHKVKINKSETKPHKILGLSKSIANRIKKLENIDYDDLRYLRTIENNKLNYMLDQLDLQCDDNYKIFFIRRLEDFNLLVSEYNYDISQLIVYLCRNIKLEQGIMSPIEGLGLLKDLNNMCRDMETQISEKYPKSLKRDHDIAAMNYKAQEDEITKKRFKEVTEKDNYLINTYSNEKYRVCAPQEPRDLIKEGKGLHHCVASYVKDVINNKCKIYFIREKNNEEKSLLTVEVRQDKIIQVKGFANRDPESNENMFINEWIKNKNLKYSV